MTSATKRAKNLNLKKKQHHRLLRKPVIGKALLSKTSKKKMLKKKALGRGEMLLEEPLLKSKYDLEPVTSGTGTTLGMP